MRPSTRAHWSSPLLIGSACCRRDDCVARGWISGRVRWRERVGRRDPHELRDTDDTDTNDTDATDALLARSDPIDADSSHPNTIDPDRHGVRNDNRGRSSPAPGDDNVRSQSHRRRSCSSRVAERGAEQHAVGLDRLRNSRGGGPDRGDRLVVAQTLRQCEDEGAGARRRATRIIVRPT